MQSTRINQYNPWDLPGGSVQFFEKSAEGLHREVKEETGLNIKMITPLSVYDAIRPHIHMTIITYLCKYTSGVISLSNEHDNYRWVSPDEIDDLEIPFWMKKYYWAAIEEYESLY